MKNILTMLVVTLMASTSLMAQGFQGQAVYQSKTAFNIKLDSSKIPPDRIKRFQEMMKRQTEKTFELNFNQTSSIYKEQVKLEQPGGPGGFRFMMAGASGTFYKDVKQETYTNQTELFGKIFLIKDSLPKLKWTLQKESKMIGNYLCFKATAVKELPNLQMNFRGPRRGDDNNKPKDTLPKTVEVTAWYTPQIPINQGPKDFWGLPGLILEVNYAKTILLCTKIVLNPKEKSNIDRPDKGKEVSQAEYDAIAIKKMKEMQDRFRENRDHGDRGSMHFRSGN